LEALKIGEGGPEKQVFNLLWPYEPELVVNLTRQIGGEIEPMNFKLNRGLNIGCHRVKNAPSGMRNASTRVRNGGFVVGTLMGSKKRVERSECGACPKKQTSQPEISQIVR
jgi:hypothetical protein